METLWTHTTVLLSEAVDALLGAPEADGQAEEPAKAPVYVDATFGRGGHSRLILSRLPANARLIAFDKDTEALAEAAKIHDARFSIRHQGFSQLDELPAASVAGVLLDLGISSPQVDNPARGFSFRSDGPLDMRMDTTRGSSVAEWLAEADVDKITEVIRDYGEERFAGPIAKAIVARRQARGAISTTTELARIVADTVKTREPGKDPATRTFQAFRIFINAELEELQQALAAALKVLQPGGRLVVISFHSLEDRIVKQFLVKHSREVFDRRVPFAAPQVMQFKVISRVKPGAAEVVANPRARSAIMRVAERLGAAAEEPHA
ncbi:MAG: 16S rRNA (cytosine(1402)-N(4))-methyltransferase [Comamonadaceae bacterium CG_4_9_14_3_um_filter_60_33]|nr:MAG: 16S rRNA (cytosine(1402)-N(4))-methyltransferase [Comamonadaceae bacterium CG2_30_59_20]PIY29548.1 MAG: 16S rRNA (cytosine(1402)-N(4))-methyltransferase [Comamonadaceae bacterium CG_4_10_14_3_um_filter_60_42]PJB46365.1 MAG: 16S rRNA (cytosine(1402)-N(4))-methyltransferase [Comamonadaceae bacterium CG_4_9_14_3_um_filter_60_33]